MEKINGDCMILYTVEIKLQDCTLEYLNEVEEAEKFTKEHEVMNNYYIHVSCKSKKEQDNYTCMLYENIIPYIAKEEYIKDINEMLVKEE